MNYYKGISLLKLLSNNMFNQFKPCEDEIVGEYLPGFYMKGRSSIDQIHILLSKLWKNDTNTQ